MANKICVECGWRGVTWRDSRFAYAILIRSGLTPKEAKHLMPRCLKCARIIARNAAAISLVSEVSEKHTALSSQIRKKITSPLKKRARVRAANNDI